MEKKCPRCEHQSLKSWHELTEEEKMVVRVKHSPFPLEQRKKHRFCVRCEFEEIQQENKV